MAQRETPGNAVYERSGDAIFQPLEGGAIVVNTRTNQIIELNGTAAMLLELIWAGLTQEEALERLLSEFTVDRETVECDVTDMLAFFRAHSLVSPRGSSDPS